MKPVICEKCCKSYIEFITRIERQDGTIVLPGPHTKSETIIIDGPVAICPDCGSRMYCEEFEQINLDNYLQAIKPVKRERELEKETKMYETLGR